nr:hypothetical protein [Treponema sp.]
MVINTLNESSLHKKLKEIYSLEEGSRREVEENGKIYDIITGQGEIIEIQTRNLSKLLPKILDLLEKGKKIKIVHPYIKEKIINTYSEEGKLLSSRKSPKKENIYSAFRELTGLYPVLLNKNFSLDLLEISMTEIRIQTSEA